MRLAFVAAKHAGGRGRSNQTGRGTCSPVAQANIFQALPPLPPPAQKGPAAPTHLHIRLRLRRIGRRRFRTREGHRHRLWKWKFSRRRCRRGRHRRARRGRDQHRRRWRRGRRRRGRRGRDRHRRRCRRGRRRCLWKTKWRGERRCRSKIPDGKRLRRIALGLSSFCALPVAIPCCRPAFVFCAVVSATAALAGHCKLCLYARCSERDGRPAHIIGRAGRRLGSSRGFGDGFERHAIALPRRQRLRGRLLEMCRRLHETSSGPRLLGAGPGEPGRRPRCPGSGDRAWSPGPGPLVRGPAGAPGPGTVFLQISSRMTPKP